MVKRVESKLCMNGLGSTRRPLSTSLLSVPGSGTPRVCPVYPPRNYSLWKRRPSGRSLEGRGVVRSPRPPGLGVSPRDTFQTPLTPSTLPPAQTTPPTVCPLPPPRRKGRPGPVGSCSIPTPFDDPSGRPTGKGDFGVLQLHERWSV